MTLSVTWGLSARDMLLFFPHKVWFLASLSLKLSPKTKKEPTKKRVKDIQAHAPGIPMKKTLSMC